MGGIETLSIDIETFSSEDLTKSGVYRYAEAPDFRVLLFGCSVNGGPVRVYDLASGGGALYGSGSYPIEYAFHLLGSTSFEADGALVKGEGTADNLVHFYMSRENVIVSTTISMDVVLPNIAVIRGSKGRIEVENFWKADHFDIIIGDERTSFRFPYVSEFKYTVDHVNSCLKEGRLTSPVVTPAVTAECVRLMEQINRKAIV